jgi:cell wall-associated NlpC family hydrolase
VFRLLLLTLLLPVLLVVAVAMALGPALSTDSGRPAGAAWSSLPPVMLGLYASAAATCPGLAWQVLAAIGTVESANGTSEAPGVHSGRNAAGAEGPMQFEPATFAAFDRPVPAGGADPPSPYDAVDAVFAAARMLCSDGAGGPAGPGAAIFDYNHSTQYVAEVLTDAGQLGFGWPGASDAGRIAVRWALGQVGTPYRWGGEDPGVGFDCSGLTQAAYAAAGIAIPRVAAAQFASGPALAPGAALAPGDLVFFGPRPGDATHVGMVVDPSGLMVDAPHTGAEVRVESFPLVVGSEWGSDVLLGATTP